MDENVKPLNIQDEIKPIGEPNDGAFIDFDSITTTSLGGSTESKTESNTSVSSDSDIDPEFAIYIIDLFITRVISVSAKFMGYEVKPDNITLTKAEITRIKPHAKKALKRFIMWLETKFPDYFAFIMVLIVTYASKTVLYAKPIPKGKPQTPPADQKPARKRPPKSTVTRTKKTNKIK